MRVPPCCASAGKGGRGLLLGGRFRGAGLPALLMAASAVLPAPLRAQDPAGRERGTASTVQPDTIPRLSPPLSPRRAFLYSLLVPGAGQGVLQRPQAGAIFVAVEAIALSMARKSLADLREAKRFAGDSVLVGYRPDPATGEPVPEFAPGRYTAELLRARRTHYEDWIAILLFNHLFAGADAFVAAHLWDLPVRVSGQRSRSAASFSVSVSWR